MPEPPSDGRYYVRQVSEGSGQWVDLLTAMNSVLDGGDFDGIVINGDSRPFAVTGYSSSLHIIKTLYGDAGSASIEGGETSFIFNRVFNAEPGALSVESVSVDIDADRVISADAGDILCSGNPATISLSRKITVDVGSLAVTGSEASVAVNETSTFFSEWASQNYGYDSFIYPEWWA